MNPAIACGLALVCAACQGTGDDPLGWGEPVGAREVRHWSRESLEAAPRWTLAETPAYIIVPDSVESIVYGRSGEILSRNEHQRYTGGAAFLPDGRVVLKYSPAAPDRVLLHLFDPAGGRETRIAAPAGRDGRRLLWSDFGVVPHGGGVVLVGNNQPVGEEPRNGADVWFADETGAFAHPQSYITTGGMLLGTLGDGSLVVAAASEDADSMSIRRILGVRPVETDTPAAPNDRAETLFTTAVPTWGPYGRPRPGSHQPAFATAAAENTIWTVPTERPELLALRPSGAVELKVEWEAGDRSMPPGAPGPWAQAERYPAARLVRIGSDGLVYVQRWTILAGRPVQDPEWLVFSPEGDLLALLHVPMAWQRILAFGDGSLVALGDNEVTGLTEVRVYGIRKPG